MCAVSALMMKHGVGCWGNLCNISFPVWVINFQGKKSGCNYHFSCLITVTYFINSGISCICFVKTEYKFVLFKPFVQHVVWSWMQNDTSIISMEHRPLQQTDIWGVEHQYEEDQFE